MCPPMWAHWRHLANLIELHSVHPSPQPKRQFDRFGHFCTAHSRKSLYFTTGDPFPKVAPSHAGIWTLSNPNLIPWAILSPQYKRHNDRFSRFRTGDRRVSLYVTMGRPFTPHNCPFPWGDLDLHLIRGSWVYLSP